MPYGLLADLLLVIHALFVAFVVGGEAAVLLGAWRGWAWVCRPLWRWLHLAAIGIVILYGLTLGYCPLTKWEYELRMAAGEGPQAGSFVGRLLQQILFVELPDWAFLPLYIAFGVLVLATLIWIPPRRIRK
jgi:hypothetical protein